MGSGNPERQRVLVVDDERDLQDIIKLVIGRTYAVEQAYDGQEMLVVVRREQPYDLILCDVRMPLLDGPSAVAKLLEEKVLDIRRTPVVFMSATDRVPKLEGKVFNFLRKPFEIVDLSNIVTRTIYREPNSSLLM